MWLKDASWMVGEVEGAAELNCEGGRSRTEALYLHNSPQPTSLNCYRIPNSW